MFESIKAGDSVICQMDCNYYKLTEDKTYKVISSYKSTVLLCTDNGQLKEIPSKIFHKH